jgi:hypothetical protein
MDVRALRNVSTILAKIHIECAERDRVGLLAISLLRWKWCGEVRVREEREAG